MVCYTNIDNYIKAEELYKEALGIISRVLGENHPDYATILSYLAGLYGKIAGLYSQKGDHTKAEELYKQALEIHSKVLGENLEYVVVLNNLAKLYHDKVGDYIKAEELYKQALEIHSKVLGENPEYVVLLNNLAKLYHDKGDYIKAEELYKEALEVDHRVLGENNPEGQIYAGNILSNLALLYQNIGDTTKAAELYQQALVLRYNTDDSIKAAHTTPSGLWYRLKQSRLVVCCNRSASRRNEPYETGCFRGW